MGPLNVLILKYVGIFNSKIFCFKKTFQKVGLEEIEKYQKGQKPYQNLYLDTNPEKVVKNS